MEPAYVVIWSFQVKAGCERQFEAAYGPEGAWVQLFRKAAGYMRTELLRDLSKAGWYVTVDYWQSPADYESFRKTFESEYKELDGQCESWTLGEHLVGTYSAARQPEDGNAQN